MIVKQFGWGVDVESLPRIGYVMDRYTSSQAFGLVGFDRSHPSAMQIVWVLYGQASRAISTG